MKKITNITWLIALAAILFSCSKKEASLERNQDQSQIAPATLKGLNYVSEWVVPALTIATNRHSFWLEGRYDLPDTAGYKYNTHKQFVFIRLKGRDSYVYKALPLQIPTTDGVIDFSYTADESGFTVKIMNNDHPDMKPTFNNYHIKSSSFRFIVLTDSTFRTHQITWTDYEAAGRALRPTIWFD